MWESLLEDDCLLDSYPLALPSFIDRFNTARRSWKGGLALLGWALRTLLLALRTLLLPLEAYWINVSCTAKLWDLGTAFLTTA